MRLGDLDALRKAIDDYAEKRQDTLLWQADIEELIDNAPTVIIDWEKSDAYLDCIKRIKSLEKENDEVRQFLKAYYERPQGEWLHPYESNIACKCSVCHMQLPIIDCFNFCPNCGASMKDMRESKSCIDCEGFGKNCKFCTSEDEE